MGHNTTQKRRQAVAVGLSAIMLVSVVTVGGAALAGTAAAQDGSQGPIRVGSSQSADYPTIQQAVDNATDGAVVEVEEGRYGPVVINRSGSGADASDLEITAIGDRGNTVIRSDQSNGEPTVAVDQDGITLEGFTIERTGSSTNVAQAVRVAGDDVVLRDNVYSVSSENDAAIGVLTESSGAAGNPTFDGEISSVEISGGEVSTDGSSGAGNVLVADSGPASFADGAVTVSDVDFSAGGSNSHLVALDTGGSVVDTTSVLTGNSFGTAAAPSAPDQTLNGFSVDSLVANGVQGAVDAASADDTVRVAPGTYDEQVIVDRADVTGLDIRSTAGPDKTTITYDGTLNQPTVILASENVRLEGFTVERTTQPGDSNLVSQAVRAEGDGITLVNNVYTATTGQGQTGEGVGLYVAAGSANPVQGTLSDDPVSVTVDGGEIRDSDIGFAVESNVGQSGGASSVDVTFQNDVEFSNNDRQVIEWAGSADVLDRQALVDQTNVDFDRAASPQTPTTVALDSGIGPFPADVFVTSSIQDAVSTADSGTTIDVSSGTYEEDVKVGVDGLTLDGAGDSETTIVGQNDRPGTLFFSANHPGVEVSGVTVESGDSQNAVHLSTGSEITDVTFSQNTFVGADGTVNVFVGGDHEDVDFEGNTFSAADGAEPIEHLYVGGAASYGAGAESATSPDTEDDVLDNVFEGTVSRSGSGNAVEFEAQHGEIRGNDFTGVSTDGGVVAVPGTVGQGNPVNIRDVNGETTRTDQIVSITGNNDGATTTDPATVSDIRLDNPSGRTLDVTVTATGEVDSGLRVELDGQTRGTGTDLTLGDGDLAGSENGDGTYTYTGTATADVASGSAATYRASVAELDGDTGTDVLPTSQSLRVAVQTLDGGSATVETGSTSVPSTTVTVGTDTDTAVTVSSSDDVPADGAQSKAALASDVQVVDEGDAVLAALNINVDQSVADTSGTLEFSVDKENVDGDPTELLVTRYSGGSYQALETSVVESDGDTITLEARTPGFSPFVVVETDASPANPEPSSGGSGGGGGGGGFALDDESVTERMYTGSLREVTVDFDQSATGDVRIDPVDGFPTGAPSPDGQVLATVDISPPDAVATDPGRVEVEIDRSTVEDAGADPADLRLLRYDERSGALEPLDTDVLSEDGDTVTLAAETPGFSVFGVVVADRETTTATATTPTPTTTAEPTDATESTDSPSTESTTDSTSTRAASPAETTTSTSAPGFGAVVAVTALLAAALLGVRNDD
jgi:PGF-CTERM protein